MKIFGTRIKALRKGTKLSQKNFAAEIGISPSAVNRYENCQAEAPYEVLVAYADYFDVSLDYLLGRADKPQGKLYDFIPKVQDNKEMKAFIDMCFDPDSPMSEKLKETLLKMMMGSGK